MSGCDPAMLFGLAAPWSDSFLREPTGMGTPLCPGSCSSPV